MLRRLPRAEQNTIVPSANRVPINRPQSLAVTMEDCGTDWPKEFLAAGKRYHFFWGIYTERNELRSYRRFFPKIQSITLRYISSGTSVFTSKLRFQACLTAFLIQMSAMYELVQQTYPIFCVGHLKKL